MTDLVDRFEELCSTRGTRGITEEQKAIKTLLRQKLEIVKRLDDEIIRVVNLLNDIAGHGLEDKNELNYLDSLNSIRGKEK